MFCDVYFMNPKTFIRTNVSGDETRCFETNFMNRRQRRERVTISYNDIDLLADFGGFMGLYIGASLLQTSLDAVVLVQHVIEKIKACI